MTTGLEEIGICHDMSSISARLAMEIHSVEMIYIYICMYIYIYIYVCMYIYIYYIGDYRGLIGVFRLWDGSNVGSLGIPHVGHL